MVTRKPDSWRPCRKVGESGRWKTTGLTKVIDKEGVRIGSLHYASFITNGATQRVGKKTGWTMHEFLLDRPGFQELVLCRIRFHPNKDNDQYAPIFAPLMIGQPQPPPGTEHQGIMGQESNGPLLNEGMEVHQNFGSYGQQQQDHIPRYIGQYGQGFGDMVENQNQFLGQEMTDRLQVPMMMNQDLNEVQLWDGYSGPSLAHHYLGQNLDPMTQHLAAQHQHFSVDEHQGLGSSFQFSGESSGQQQNDILGTQKTYHSLMDDPPHLAQATEEEQHQDFGSSALFWAQKDDLVAPGELSAQQQSLMQDSNLSLTQQKNQIFGQVTYLSPLDKKFWETDHSQVPVMVDHAFEEQQHVPWSAQPYSQYEGQNSTLPTVTPQQHDNAIRNLPAQLQLEEQDNVPLMNQATEEQAAYLPMNQGIDEPHGGIVGYL